MIEREGGRPYLQQLSALSGATLMTMCTRCPGDPEVAHVPEKRLRNAYDVQACNVRRIVRYKSFNAVHMIKEGGGEDDHIVQSQKRPIAIDDK